MDNVTVIVAPRERYSSLIGTLDELIATIPDSTPLIVVEGGSPAWVRRKIHHLRTTREFTWVSEKRPLIPNRARNIGLQRALTEFVVFVDNDIMFEPFWLEKLVERGVADRADVVAPLICIGPPRATMIHHAGGSLSMVERDGDIVVAESHRLMDVPMEKFSEKEAPADNEVCEFHCALVRRDLFDRIGLLDERLITREQMDFALRCKEVGAVVRFEKEAFVTYFARVDFRRDDLSYHLFRWSDELALRSMDAFEETWKTKLDRNRIRYGWIRNHRRRAILSTHHFLRIIPGLLRNRLLTLIERAATRNKIPPLENCLVPPQPKTTAALLLDESNEKAAHSRPLRPGGSGA